MCNYKKLYMKAIQEGVLDNVKREIARLQKERDNTGSEIRKKQCEFAIRKLKDVRVDIWGDVMKLEEQILTEDD